jgi:carboxymethylenebutenolidase
MSGLPQQSAENDASLRRNVCIETSQGPMQAIVARPQGAGPFPPVITYPHVGGLTGTMRIMAQKVADAGYICVVPDLYHRLGTIVLDPQSLDENVIAIRKIAAASVTDEGAMEDTAAVFRWLERQPEIRGPRCATIGYGRGGSLAIRAASAFPATVRAVASVLGFGFVSQGRTATREMLAGITGSVYCAFAEHDDIIPAAEHALLTALLREVSLDARIVIHEGARHPYFFPDRAVYDEAAAARDWAAIFSIFSRRLGQDTPA